MVCSLQKIFPEILGMEVSKVKIKIILLIMALVLGWALHGEAWGPGGRSGWSARGWQRGCFALEVLDLSEKQRQEVEKINNHYSPILARMREDLLSRRLEMVTLLRDPFSPQEAIEEKTTQLISAHQKFQEKMLEYQLRLRALLGPEQVSRWCTLMGIGPGKGWWMAP